MRPITVESFNILIESLERYFVLGDRFKRLLRTTLFEIEYKKGSRILSAGSKQKIVWFMLEGLAREIRVDEETFEEQTLWFWFELDFLYTTPGFFSREESETAIELLEDCKMVFISYENWSRLKSLFKETEPTTENVRGEYDRLRKLHAEDIKNLGTVDRYLKHEAILKKLFARTKLGFIAEFMGMAPDTLGKLRKKYS